MPLSLYHFSKATPGERPCSPTPMQSAWHTGWACLGGYSQTYWGPGTGSHPVALLKGPRRTFRVSNAFPLRCVPLLLCAHVSPCVFKGTVRTSPDRAASAKCHSGFLPAEGGRAAGRRRLLSNMSLGPGHQHGKGCCPSPEAGGLWLCSAPSVNPKN